MKQRGGSTPGGRKVWFDRDKGTSNYDGRGEYLGEFQSEDTILVVQNSGEFYATNFDLNNHYDDGIRVLEKYDPNKVWTAVLTMPTSRTILYQAFLLRGNRPQAKLLGRKQEQQPHSAGQTSATRV